MKVVKTIGILLLVVFAIAAILSIIMPVKQHIQRSILIDAKPAEVYEYLSRLDNFNSWSVWSQGDSTIKHTISGNDGTLNASSKWSGDPGISGEGTITISSLEINSEIEHLVTFHSPKKIDAKSEFDLEEVNGQTKVTWQFDIATPRPWNIFNVISSLDKKMGEDFENGLRNLKKAVEAKKGIKASGKTYDVVEMNFPATTYLTTGPENVPFDSISSYFSRNFVRLYEQILSTNNTPGIPSGLFYELDENNARAEMAAGIPVTAGTKVADESLKELNIAGSKALYIDYYGDYTKTQEAYKTLNDHLAMNSLKRKPPYIEQYLTDPAIVKDTTKWLTRIIVLVE